MGFNVCIIFAPLAAMLLQTNEEGPRCGHIWTRDWGSESNKLHANAV